MSRTRPGPPYPPFPPYPPYSPYPPYPPHPPYPANLCQPCSPAADASTHPGDAGDSQTGIAAPPEQSSGPQTPESEQHDGSQPTSDPTSVEPTPDDPSAPQPPPSSEDTPIIPGRISVRRPDDLLVFDATFSGFVLKTDPARLVRSASDAFIVIDFPPQSFGEEAFLESAGQKFDTPKDETTEVSDDPRYPKKNVPGDDETPPTALPAARVRMAGPSRVAVTMPAALSTTGYDVASLLRALRDWPMRLDINAVADRTIDLDALLKAARADGIEQLTIAAEPIMAASAVTSAPAVAPSPVSGVAGIDDLAAVAEAGVLALQRAPHEPASTVTALELPYRVVTSPLAPARWQHTIDPVVHRSRTELWHTRLTTSTSGAGADIASRIRALWSPDYRPKERMDELLALLVAPGPPADPPQPNPDLIRMSLDPLDRSMLVTAMSGFDEEIAGGTAYRPISSEAKRLHLSALGALLDAEGTWTRTPEHIDLQQWRHVATLGRDQYVRVMYAGYLWPFGHAAALIKVTERKFESLDGKLSQRVALLRQRFFVAVREPVRTYNGANHEFQGRNFPFTRVELLTRVTPDLSDPGVGDSALQPGPGVTKLYDGLSQRMLFWATVPAGGGKLADVPFDITAIDIAGRPVTFSLPLLFVGKLADANRAADVCTSYNAAPAATKRRATTCGAVVTYAPTGPADKSDTALPTQTLAFRAAALKSGTPKVYPEIETAQVGIKPIQKLLGQQDFIAEVAYPDFYASHGFDPSKNAGQIFLKLTSSKKLPFGGSPQDARSDTLGALATPQMSLLGLSKIMGPVSGQDAGTAQQVEDGLKTVRDGAFDPTQFFQDATLLGGVRLAEILPIASSLAGTDVPKMVARDFPDRVEARFEWSGDVTKSDQLNLLIPRADTSKPPTRLTMNGLMTTPLDPAAKPSAEATATLTNFKLNLFGFIILWFEEVAFTAKNGQKPDVTVQLREGDDAVCFGGPLEFVNDLRRFIPGNGFSDPPGLAVTPSGLSASYSLTLPSVGVGVFALTNASLGAAFNLPFDAKPVSVKFNFSKREQPFSLTVSLLGGGGFFAIGVSARGVDEIEAALEFGAAIVIDLGVASGGVEVKAGIYFHWLEVIPNQGSVELAGYVRIHGELTVLAIISVSLTFNLQIGYLKADGKSIAYGEATLTVEIEILMFSAEVSVKCRREFAGGAADPRFLDLMPTPQLWADYCAAFADEGI